MAQSPDPADSLAGASNAAVHEERDPNKAREIQVYTLDKDVVDTGFDFRPVPVEVKEGRAEEELVTDPKDSSAPEPVDSSRSETMTENPSSETPVLTVPPSVVKDTTQPKESSTGTPTSSPKTKSGKSEPTASE
jgi:hypothetical protein